MPGCWLPGSRSCLLQQKMNGPISSAREELNCRDIGMLRHTYVCALLTSCSVIHSVFLLSPKHLYGFLHWMQAELVHALRSCPIMCTGFVGPSPGKEISGVVLPPASTLAVVVVVVLVVVVSSWWSWWCWWSWWSWPCDVVVVVVWCL